MSINDPRAFQGYTLVASMGSTITYLIDMDGRVVQRWEDDSPLAASVYLLENGHLLRTSMAGRGPFGRGGGPPGPSGPPRPDGRPPRRDIPVSGGGSR